MTQALAVPVLVLSSALLVAVPHLANASCVWVLWGRDVSAVGWQIGKAFESLTDCEAAAQKIKDTGEELNKAIGKHLSHDVRCYPDTIDPRGPKGGER